MLYGITGRRCRAHKLVVLVALAVCLAPASAPAAGPLQQQITPGATLTSPTLEITQIEVLGPSTVRVHGLIYTHNLDTSVHLRFGDRVVLDQSTPTVEVNGGVQPTKFVEDLLDLQPGTSYNVQFVADTPVGPVTGSSVPFTTPAAVFVNRSTGVVSSSLAKKSTRCTIAGTARRDRLVGTKKRDVICGLGGNDRILGRGGNDLILAGKGGDTASGGAGRDRIHGNSGSDRLHGNRGRDRLYGNNGRDRLNTASNRRRGDIVNGGKGRDRATVNKGDHLRSVERVVRRKR
jgi:hypothetical protein